MGLWVCCPSSAEGRSGAAELWGREARGGWRRAPAALPSFGEEAFGPFPSPGSRCRCLLLLPQVGKAVFSPPAPGGAAPSEVGGYPLPSALFARYNVVGGLFLRETAPPVGVCNVWSRRLARALRWGQSFAYDGLRWRVSLGNGSLARRTVIERQKKVCTAGECLFISCPVIFIKEYLNGCIIKVWSPQYRIHQKIFENN